MNNLVNGIIVLAVITALVLSIIALVQCYKSKFEDSDAVPIIMNDAMKLLGVRKNKNNEEIPYGQKFKNNYSETAWPAVDIENLSKETSPDKPCLVNDICYFVKGPN